MSIAEKYCKWNFAPRVGGIDQGPNEAIADIFKKLQYASLVRESIQNSLDAAKNEDEPVIVTFKRSSFDTRNFPMLFKLKDHIKSCLNTWRNEDAKKRFQPMLDCIEESTKTGRMHYLEVSDENTTGMSYTKGSKRSPFYAFVKSIGNSVKSNSAKGGSHGYGKAAYFNSSKLRTVLISTLTEDGQYVFEGVSGLCTHEMEGKKREHYGYYTDSRFGDSEEPITKEEDIPMRFLRQTVGTSAFIIGVDYGEKGIARMEKRILESVITNFWAAILDKKLEIHFAIDEKYTLDASNVFQYAEDCFPEADDSKTYFSNPRPYMDVFANVGKDFNHMKFEEILPTLGKVELFLTRTKSGTDSFVMMRSPLMMVKSLRNRTNYGFYGVFICRDTKGNEVLRTMEDGSHSEWNYRNCEDRNDKEKAKIADEEIKEFLDRCITKVFRGGNTTTLTFGGLEEFLTIPSSLDDEEGFGGETESDSGKGDGERTEMNNTEPTSEVDENESGFTEEPDTEGYNGQVVIHEGTNGLPASDGGEAEDGNTPEGHIGEHGSSGSLDGKGREGIGSNNGLKDVPGYEPGEGMPLRRTRLNVRCRAFAQASAGGGYLHRLVINSNRASDNAIIQVSTVGEFSDEAIPIKYADQGTWSGNIISNVKLEEGRNVINIKFNDDMRHCITLYVNEDQL